MGYTKPAILYKSEALWDHREKGQRDHNERNVRNTAQRQKKSKRLNADDGFELINVSVGYGNLCTLGMCRGMRMVYLENDIRDRVWRKDRPKMTCGGEMHE